MTDFKKLSEAEPGNNAMEGCIEYYSPLDNLNRTGPAYAIICKKTVKQGKHRKNNSKPSGWKSIQDKSIPGGYLYNRCHLIGCQLIEKLYKKGTPGTPCCNVRKVITGTRYLNECMLIYETMVVDYLKMHPEIHVFYRTIPEYRGDCLLAEGVRIEAISVEDGGNSLWLRAYCFNEQPGIRIDYKKNFIHRTACSPDRCHSTIKKKWAGAGRNVQTKDTSHARTADRKHTLILADYTYQLS